MNKIRELEWVCWHKRKRTPFFVSCWTEGLARPRRALDKFDYSIKHIGHFDDNVIMSKNDFDAKKELLRRGHGQDTRFIYNLIQDYYEHYSEALQEWEAIHAEKELNNKTNEKLAVLIEKYFESMARKCSLIMIFLFLEDELIKEAESELKKHFAGERWKEASDILLNQTKKSITQKERLSILKISEKIKEKKCFDVELDQHITDFSWMRNQLFTGDYFPQEHYIKNAKEYVGRDIEELIKEEEEEHNKKLREIEEYMKNIECDSKLTALIETIQELIYFRNFRAERLYQSSFYVQPLLSEISRRFGVSDKDIVYLTPREIMELLRKGKKPVNREIESRKEGFSLLTNINNGQVISGKKLKEIKENVNFEPSGKLLKGQATYQGKARGSVVIINNQNDLTKIKKGDILVTHMTTPAFAMALDKVSGIVTEEGGLLCHATTLSREFKIPCIIGTKTATKILKDGDIIELDSKKGEVRKTGD